MRKIRVYIDTSVFGGTQDEQFSMPTRRFFERVRMGEFTVLLSRTTLDELQQAPDAVKAALRELQPTETEEVATDSEVEDLAAHYVRAGVLGEASLADATHVAAATVAAADLIVSWNFRHIVNYSRIRGFNGVNTALGYRAMIILSPLEVAYDNETKDV